MSDKKIYVTQPSLPPLEEFIPYLEKIWDNKWLTNNGPFHQQLEKELADYLGVEYISLFTNGTVALVTALQALRISGEVITTPFSFVATAHSLLWNNIEPVFVDIDPDTFNLDPRKIEDAITPRTSAIMPVHVYGRPCNVEEIKRIADTYGLKVIYDAAHAFGVNYRGESVLKFGDLSVLSFHATKVFNTFEGGAIICPNKETKQRIDYLKNFGFVDETIVVAPGINGKMNEVQASFGLLQLNYIEDAIIKRKRIDGLYREMLTDVRGIELPFLPKDSTQNYSYFPVVVGQDFPITCEQLYKKFRENDVFARRYFFPLISEFPMYRRLPSANIKNLRIATSVSESVICLPIYPDLQQSEIEEVVKVIKSC